jgi:hypothetical protein
LLYEIKEIPFVEGRKIPLHTHKLFEKQLLTEQYESEKHTTMAEENKITEY